MKTTTITPLLLLVVIAASCIRTEDELLSTPNLLLESHTLSSAVEEYYYWYKGERIYLTADWEQVNVITTDGKLTRSSAAAARSLKQGEQTKYVLPFFEREGAEPIGTSDIFYLKLKTAEDIALLNKMAAQLGVQVIKDIPYTPLWYVLSIRGSDFNNSIEAGNYFYETGNFADVDPAFMFDFRASDLPNDPLFMQQWGLRNLSYPVYDISAVNAWNITRGAGVVVAVLDTGIEFHHDDLEANIHPLSFDALSGTSPSRSTVMLAHGTKVAGIIAAVRNNNRQVVGVAPEAKIMGISHRVLGANNNSHETYGAELASGINFAWKNGADVINNSWGDRGGEAIHMHSALLEQAIDSAMRFGRGGKGTVVVFGSGNDALAMNYPANFHPDILTVGAITDDGVIISDYETYQPMLDVMAPGWDVLTTTVENGTDVMDFSSAAAPHAAGIAALILSANPNLTQKQVVDRIERYTRKVGSGYSITSGRTNGTWSSEMGYGLVNAHAALLSKRPVETIFTSYTQQTNYFDSWEVWRYFNIQSPSIAYPRTVYLTYEEEWGGDYPPYSGVNEYTDEYLWPAGQNSVSFSLQEYEDQDSGELTVYREVKSIEITSTDPNYYYLVGNGQIAWSIPLATYLKRLTLSPANIVVDSTMVRKGR